MHPQEPKLLEEEKYHFDNVNVELSCRIDNPKKK